MGIKTSELFNFYSHLSGVIAAVVGTVFLAFVSSESVSGFVTAMIYGGSVVFLFLASSLYHAFKKEENEVSVWRKMDHLAIFFMIAGTYTPVSYFYLEGPWKWAMIITQWSLVLAGALLQVLFPKAPRALNAVIYLTMGWLAVLPLKQILSAMTVSQEVLMFSGGIAFTIGGVIYALKRPRMFPGIFGFHELFHIMVLVGGILHYAMVYRVYLEL